MIKNLELQGDSLVPAATDVSPVLACIDPSAEERDFLRSTFRIDDHTLSSTLDPDEVSRIEVNADHLLVIWKRPRSFSAKDADSFTVGSMGLFLYADRLLIIATNDIQPVVGRPSQPVHTLADVMLGIMFQSIHHYTEHLRVIKMISRELQQKINASMENRHLIQMFILSESLVYYLNAINSNGAVLTRLRTHADKAGFSAEAIAFLDDLLIENNQCYKQAEIYSTIFTGLMDARGNIVNNNMNVLLKNLTIINVVFLPLNLIAGIGGMSEFSMMTHGMDWRISYGFFLVAMVVVGWITAWLLKRVKFGGSAAAAPSGSPRR